MSIFNPAHPENWPRRILLVAAGLTPQVVTETIYGLAISSLPPFIPTEIHLVTTKEGAERARLTLLSEDPGWLKRLLREYGLPEIFFPSDNIHVIRDRNGLPLDDIRSVEDNESTADAMTDAVRRLTEDPEAALHVSLAGGRKTMGFYLGYALSLYGRSQDRLSHVLVSPPFESHPDFYYPTRASRVIYTLDAGKRPVDTRDAQVTLANIPFVRLRHGLPEDLIHGKTRFTEAVNAVQKAVGPPRLVLDLENRMILAGNAKARLAPADLAFLSWLARRKKEGRGPVTCPGDGVYEKEYASEYLVEYGKIVGYLDDDGPTAKRLRDGMDKGFFLERKSKLHGGLKKALGYSASGYFVQSEGMPRDKRFLLGIPAEAIQYGKVER